MKIAVIGTGNAEGTLGSHWAEGGYEIIFDTRDMSSDRVKTLLKSAGQNAQATGVREAAAAANVVVFAVLWAAAQDVIRSAGDFAGKVVIDCMNPIGEHGLTIGLTTSAAEQVATWTEGARVVKAFNTTGFQNSADPIYGAQSVTMFICGDDIEAKTVVSELTDVLGFEVCDIGPLYTAQYLEPLAMLWVHLVYAEGLGPNIVFKLIKR